MPRSLVIDGFEVLAAHPDCEKEAGAGLALFPAINISAFDGHLGSVGRAVSSTITPTPDIQGPGVAQFTVSFDAEFESPGSQDDREHFIGSSTSTFFVGGRIVRYDRFTPFQTDQPFAEQQKIGCTSSDTAQPFYVTSYWSFAESAESIGRSGDLLQGLEPAPQEGCVVYGAQQVGIATAWSNRPVGTRYDANGTMHIFDFVRKQPVINPGTLEITSALQVGAKLDTTSAAQACNTMLA